MTIAAGGSGSFINPKAIAESFGLEKGMKVADFGCGSGYFTFLIAEKIGPEGEVSALDVLSSALETIRGRAAALGLKNIRPIRANLENAGGSKLPNESQDIVLMASIFFQTKQRKKIFEEAERILAPRGMAVVIDWKKDTAGLGPPPEQRVGPEEIKKLAEEIGLRFAGEIDAGAFHFGLKFKKS